MQKWKSDGLSGAVIAAIVVAIVVSGAIKGEIFRLYFLTKSMIRSSHDYFSNIRSNKNSEYIIVVLSLPWIREGN